MWIQCVYGKAEPRPDMNIKVVAFSESKKSINIKRLHSGVFTLY